MGINGWCSALFTLACVAIIRIEGHISLGRWADACFTSRYFAQNLLAIGFLYCAGALVFAGRKNHLVPVLGMVAALLLAAEDLFLSLMFIPFLLTTRL